MQSEILEIYTAISEKLSQADREEPYREKEMEKISRKVSNFLQSLEPESMEAGSLNIALLIYTHFQETHGKIRIIPYKGKGERDPASLDFDLKNIPPCLARIISRWVDLVFG